MNKYLIGRLGILAIILTVVLQMTGCQKEAEPEIVHVEKVTLSQTTLQLNIGDSEELSATVSPYNADDSSLVWGSSDQSVLVIEENNGKQCTIKALKKGVAVITATANDGGKSAQCEVEVLDKNLYVDKTEFNLNGEAQTVSFEISGDVDWKISAGEDLVLSQTSGFGPATINVEIGERLDSERIDSIIVKTNDYRKSIKINQTPVYIIEDEEIHLRDVYGYADVFHIYAKRKNVSVEPFVKDNKYYDRLPELTKKYNDEAYPMTLTPDGYVMLIHGFAIYINDTKDGMPDMAFAINQSTLEPEDRLPFDYYLSKDHEFYQECIKNGLLDFTMLASWPSPTDNGIRFQLCFRCEDNLSLISSYSNYYNVEYYLTYSLFNYHKPESLPDVGKGEYGMIKDRFEGRKFKDDDNNVYEFRVTHKKLKDIPNISKKNEHLYAYYSVSSNPLNVSHPIMQIFKNGELWYELVAYMYVEWLGTSFNTGQEGYATGFSSYILSEEGSDSIYFESESDDDGKLSYWFDIHQYDFVNGELENYRRYKIPLYYIDDGRKLLAK